MKMSQARPITLALLLPLAVVACQKSGSPTAASAASQPSGQVKRLGSFTLTIPKTWTAYGHDDPIIRNSAQVKAKTEKEEEMLRTAKLMLAGPMFRLLAFDPNSSKPGFVNNLNVLVTTVPSGTTLASVVEKAKSMMGILGKVSEEKDASYGGVPFHKMVLNSDSPTPGKSLIIRSYTTVRGTENVTFTFTSTSDSDPSFTTDTEAIMASLTHV